MDNVLPVDCLQSAQHLVEKIFQVGFAETTIGSLEMLGQITAIKILQRDVVTCFVSDRSHSCIDELHHIWPDRLFERANLPLKSTKVEPLLHRLFSDQLDCYTLIRPEGLIGLSERAPPKQLAELVTRQH